MKTVFVLFSVFVFSCSLIAQPVFKKQISFLDFDARNPSFIETNIMGYYPHWFGSPNALLFEGYKDPTQPQIFVVKYDLEKDTFSSSTQITFSKGSCINPCGIFYPIGNIAESDKIIWQTNENGTWDIASGELFGDTLRNVRYIAHDSLLDETNPQLVACYYPFQFVLGMTYEKAGSIFLYYEIDTNKVTEKIFDGTGVDSYEYGKASAALSMQLPTHSVFGVVAAEKRFQNGDRKIVYKMKDYDSLNWAAEKYLYDPVITTVSPRLFPGLGEPFTVFETVIDNKRKLKFYFNPQNFGQPESVENISDSTYESSNYSMRPIMMITKHFKKSFNSFGQSIYEIKKGSNNYLRPSFYSDQYPYKDSLIELKIDEPKITTSNVGFKGSYIWAYSVWEDSSDDGTIQLFGSSGAYNIGGIENETSPEDFTLYQNYPNPFNPETVISFKLSARSNVSLKIFDVLGREVATLVNEEKPAGEYQVLFNNQLTTNHKLLSSGVLFYQLKVGNRLQTKSMLLLK